MDDLRIGVIGAGGRGLLAKYAHNPGKGSRLVAASDINPEALELFKQTAGGNAFVCDDYRRVLDRKDVDAVFLTTPDFLHEEQGAAALEAGKHLYLEKPMAITIEGCDRLLETAKRTGTKLFVGHNMRYFPSVLKMKEIIASGAIGNVQSVWCRHFVSYGCEAYFKNWHSEQKYCNGLLLQKGAHDIDVIHWLAGAYAKKVCAMGRLSVYDRCSRQEGEQRVTTWPPLSQKGVSKNIDIEDHNMLMMELENGIQASYLQCHYTPDSERNYTFIGDAGRLENEGDFGNCRILVWNKRGARNAPDVIHNIRTPEDNHGGADPEIVAGFIKFVAEGQKPHTSPVAARYAVATGVKGHESMRSGCSALDVPELSRELSDYFDNGQTGKK
ncbi:MAG: Gfo/Idh/MocA family oxidoreductase [Victivallaceae bacterium]|jgi:predicted dehydrogenase